MGDNRENVDKIIETSDLNREIKKNCIDTADEDPGSVKTKMLSYR